VCCAVRDCGVGIPIPQRERIFEPFVRLRVDRTGSGIGLTIVKRIVDLYGGTVWVESDSDAGCTVKFTLPMLSDFGSETFPPDVTEKYGASSYFIELGVPLSREERSRMTTGMTDMQLASRMGGLS
ncbi:MAG: sensor histidine kinase, partial [Nitrospiraceae bacterium]